MKIEHGEWVYGKYGIPHCSECGYTPKHDKVTSICPECNAVMETEQEDILGAAIGMALNKYGSDYVDVVYNELTGYLDIMYCGHNDSYPIYEDVVEADFIDKNDVIKICDGYCVGLVW